MNPDPRISRVAALLAVTVLAAGCASVGTPAPAASLVPTSTPLVEDVEIGGRTMHLECRGTVRGAAPTVIFENGLGGSSSSWRPVMDQVVESFRACTYDRAGLGLSDPPPAGTRTAADRAIDLGLMLDAAGIAPPYVFVSHSLGPWVTTLFTASRTEAVVGLVFVDPRGPDVTESWIAGLGHFADGEPEAVTGFRAYATSFLEDPSANDELLDIRASEAQVRGALAAPKAFGEIPLIVLSASGTPDDWRDLPPRPLEAWKAAWFDGHRSLAAASSTGRVVEVPESGHMIQLSAPDAVVDAVVAVAGAG